MSYWVMIGLAILFVVLCFCNPIHRWLGRLVHRLRSEEGRQRTDEETPPQQPMIGGTGRPDQPVTHRRSSSTVAQPGGRRARSRTTTAMPPAPSVREPGDRCPRTGNLVNESNRGRPAIRDFARSEHQPEAGESHELQPLAPTQRNGRINSPDERESSGNGSFIAPVLPVLQTHHGNRDNGHGDRSPQRSPQRQQPQNTETIPPARST